MIPALDFAQGTLPRESLGGLTLFEVRSGFKHRMHYDWEKRTTEFSSPQEELSRTEAQQIARKIQHYVNEARSAMSGAQDRMTVQENRHRREPDFDVGDKVYIIKKVWSTDCPSDKLDHPLTRQSFRIVGRRGHSYVLEVPDSWKGLTADRLRRFPDNPLPGQELPRPEGELVYEGDGEEEWEVEEVLTSRTHYNKLQYQVQWR